MEWSTPSKPTVWQPDTDVTSRLCRSRYSPSSSFSRAKNHITPNIKTRPPAKPAAAPHSPAVVPPIIPPTAAPTTVRIIGRRQPMICIADLSDRSHCSLFPVPQSIERRPRPDLWPLPFWSSVSPGNLLPVRRKAPAHLIFGATALTVGPKKSKLSHSVRAYWLTTANRRGCGQHRRLSKQQRNRGYG